MNLPAIKWGGHIIESLMEMGPADQGPSPVTFREIEAWARMTRVEIPGWEALMLREMSIVYCQELAAASAPDRPEPARPISSREAVAEKFRAAIAQHKGSQ